MPLIKSSAPPSPYTVQWPCPAPAAGAELPPAPELPELAEPVAAPAAAPALAAGRAAGATPVSSTEVETPYSVLAVIVTAPVLLTGTMAWFTADKAPVHFPGAAFIVAAIFGLLAIAMLRRLPPATRVADQMPPSVTA